VALNITGAAHPCATQGGLALAISRLPHVGILASAPDWKRYDKRGGAARGHRPSTPAPR
jgi:hypothetical protein